MRKEKLEKVFFENTNTCGCFNDGGVVKMYCIGQKPTADYTLQATITEVTTNG